LRTAGTAHLVQSKSNEKVRIGGERTGAPLERRKGEERPSLSVTDLLAKLAHQHVFFHWGFSLGVLGGVVLGGVVGVWLFMQKINIIGNLSGTCRERKVERKPHPPGYIVIRGEKNKSLRGMGDLRKKSQIRLAHNRARMNMRETESLWRTNIRAILRGPALRLSLKAIRPISRDHGKNKKEPMSSNGFRAKKNTKKNPTEAIKRYRGGRERFRSSSRRCV